VPKAKAFLKLHIFLDRSGWY